MEHLQKFISPDKVSQLKHTSLTLFVEHSEITEVVFDNEMFNLIKELEKYIVTLHVTDQLCYNNYTVCLKAQIAIFAGKKYQDPILKSLQLIMLLVKKISRGVSISKRAMKVINQHRKLNE